MAGISRGCRGLDISGAGKRQPPRIDTGNAPYTCIARALVSTVLFFSRKRTAGTNNRHSLTDKLACTKLLSINTQARTHATPHPNTHKPRLCSAWLLRVRPPRCLPKRRLLVSLLSGVASRAGARATPTKSVCWCRCSPVSLPVSAHVRLQRRVGIGGAPRGGSRCGRRVIYL